LSLGWQSDDYLVTSAFENALRVIDMLTSKQRAFLKSQAHSMKPIVQIGKNGLNDQIKTSVRNALDARELIKVTLLQNTDEVGLGKFPKSEQKY
jgi:RNA-binding protein